MKKTLILLIAAIAIFFFRSYAQSSVTFTPTTVGWYRIASPPTFPDQGGRVTIFANYDNSVTDIEFQFNIGGYGVGGSIQQTRYSSYTGGSVDQLRISSDGAANAYLDIHVSSATSPGPITIVGYGPVMPAFVATPVVGAMAGSTNINVLTLQHGFNTSQGATFAQTGGNVGIGTSTPESKFHVVVKPDSTEAAINIGNVNAGNIYVPIGASCGGYNIDFHTFRDIVPNQIGARIRSERINIYQDNNALIQAMDLAFSTSNGIDQTNLGERMRIKFNGNVGIGTTIPGERLEVNGNILADGSIVTNAPSNGNTFFQATTAGTLATSLGSNTSSSTNVYGAPANTSFVGNAQSYPLVFTTSGVEHLRITAGGSVGIGTTTPDEALAVNGNIHAKEVRVDLTGWEDRVFKRAYKLSPLSTIKTYVDLNHHLPDMPSESEILKTGLNIGSIEKLLTKKVEELTLYMIDQQKEIAALKQQLATLNKENHKTTNR